MSENGEEKVIRLRGLPWSATVDNILDFFKDIEIKGGKDGVHLTMSKDGRFNGEAFVELGTQDDISVAEKLHKEHIGKRYVEVFSIKRSEMEWAFERAGLSRNEISSDCVVKLRGLPYDCTKEEISNFFSGFKICPDGIALPTNPQGRPTGDAFVQFVNQEYADKALEKHREHIDTASKSSRYVEVFRSSLDEVRTVMNNMAGGGGPMGGNRGGGGYGNNRSAPYDTRDRVGGMNRGGGFNDGPGWGGPGGPPGGMMGGNNFNGGGGNMGNGGHFVHMMGLPFRASEMDIANFFVPLNPINIFLGKDKSGRASGKADVEFATHDDATEAMKKDKTNMQHRYIELFLNSKPGSSPMGSFGPIGGSMGGQGGPSGNFGNMGNNFGGPMGGPQGDFGNNFGPVGGPMMGPGNNMGFNNEPSRGPTAGHFVHMRGLPFVATEMDIADFFLPVKPINIYVDKDSSGRASGKAEVEFATHDDAVIAMKKDKENMQHRYINLFLNSKPGPVGGGGGNGNMGGGFGNNNGNNSPGFGNFGSNIGNMGPQMGGNMGPPMGGNMGPPMGGHFVNMRGLPFSATEQDVADFFAPVVPFNIFIGKEPNGRATGKAEVEFSTHADAIQAMKKDKENMQHRYIDLLLNSKPGGPPMGGGNNMGGPQGNNFGGMGNNGPGFGGNMGNNGPGPGFGGPGNMGGGNFGNMGGGHFVSMRGLPFSATEQDIADFFRPVNPMNINIMRDNSGRASGKAEVEFATHDDASQAMKKDKENMQHRYIDLLLNSKPGPPMGGPPGNMGGPPGNMGGPQGNMGGPPGNFGGMGNSGPGMGGNMGGFNDRGNMGPNMNGGGHIIQMRGLPFNCTEQEIADFFHPVNPLNIFIGKEPNGRSTGKAEVEFATYDDATEAMKKDKENIQHRYIDLFLNSKPLGKMGGGNFGNSGNNVGFNNRGGFGSR